jgi:hypothetical protein
MADRNRQRRVGGGSKRRCDHTSGPEWVPGFRDGTGRRQIGCWPRQFARWEVRSRDSDGRELEEKKPIYGRLGCVVQASVPVWARSRAGLVLERGMLRNPTRI